MKFNVLKKKSFRKISGEQSQLTLLKLLFCGCGAEAKVDSEERDLERKFFGVVLKIFCEKKFLVEYMR